MSSEQDERLQDLRKQLNECMMKQWKFCAAGILLGMPLSVKRKSYFPFVFGGIAGTGVDFIYGYQYECKPIREQIDEIVKMQKTRGSSATSL